MTVRETQRIHVIDSHTGGEPTRVIISGGPDLGEGSFPERRDLFRERFDAVRSAVVEEPRGSDVIVGALLSPPTDPQCSAGVIFFNNAGYLGMCGHGTIGLMVTLSHLDRIECGEHLIETPVGIVTATLLDSARVKVTNVPSYRTQAAVTVDVEGYGAVTGDVAWGGNWFFLVSDHGEDLRVDNVTRLTDVTRRIGHALQREGVTGADGELIDHIELFGAPQSDENHSRNFVLCPGGAYDRSPCGTGTSAKLACLAADGRLQPGECWRQESIVGSVFEASFQSDGDRVIPSITGSAWVNAEATLLLDPRDPFATGIRK